mmetsp:Transcript_34453/g.73084  ORF Transcript_34453/g.73084 Transcript_34453/m.73084 type:complete len:203 (+) Transcript_34453:465-1073(+)
MAWRTRPATRLATRLPNVQQQAHAEEGAASPAPAGTAEGPGRPGRGLRDGRVTRRCPSLRCQSQSLWSPLLSRLRARPVLVAASLRAVVRPWPAARRRTPAAQRRTPAAQRLLAAPVLRLLNRGNQPPAAPQLNPGVMRGIGSQRLGRRRWRIRSGFGVVCATRHFKVARSCTSTSPPSTSWNSKCSGDSCRILSESLVHSC